ncbi:protein takeout precursor, putative [Pediculus humanus corporis]|uniref:Protein takeout, putative n=1 Tax=Pediculus humanus subsp. corporis TaxID=121224 RepID=E0VZJ6_PEDHC|nr:protein takeout precursor, putative [Pediculus humanus corporis]EEB18802.1 protein takeout precursor, putative [Pediculus humanus corporis]
MFRFETRFIIIIIVSLILCNCNIAVGKTEDNKIKKIPTFLKICSQSDPNLNGCVKDSVEKLRPHLVTGIPEFGIPPCEPLIVPEIVINQGKGPVTVQSTYTNIHVTGASQFVIKSIKVEPAKDRVRLKLWLPFLHMISDYDLDGKILMMPITGKGMSEGNYTDIEANVLMEGERFEKKGQTYFNVKDFFVHFNIGHASIRLDDLFNGDKELGDAMNSFLNQNWESIVDEIKPVLEDRISDMFKTFSNNIYHKYPLDMILPP